MVESDPIITQKLDVFTQSIDKMEGILETALSEDVTKDLNMKDRLNHDLFMAYMLNTLYWCYLRSKGLDPNTNKVKDEITRVRQYMINAKQAIDRHTVRKTINKPVADRFIKHGIQKRKHTGDKKTDNNGPFPKKQQK